MDTGAQHNLPLLRAWAGRVGAPLTERQITQFLDFREELLAWNARRANLTAITDPQEVEARLFLESLSCAAALPVAAGQRLIDVGSGGGFPGLPLAIAFETLDVTLLEATGRKVRFLEHAVSQLSLTNVSVIHGRAEDLAHEAAHRERYDIAAARALAPLPVLAELCLPFVRTGGVLIAPRGADAASEAAGAARALAALGGSARGIIAPPDPAMPIAAGHCLVVMRKDAPTPPAYPRRAGVPARRPL